MYHNNYRRGRRGLTSHQKGVICICLGFIIMLIVLLISLLFVQNRLNKIAKVRMDAMQKKDKNKMEYHSVGRQTKSIDKVVEEEKRALQSFDLLNAGRTKTSKNMQETLDGIDFPDNFLTIFTTVDGSVCSWLDDARQIRNTMRRTSIFDTRSIRWTTWLDTISSWSFFLMNDHLTICWRIPRLSISLTTCMLIVWSDDRE